MGRAEDNKRDKLERILRAGRELFAQHGYAGTTMNDVAARAGVSKGALYFHVGSKNGLLNEVFGADFNGWIDEAFEQDPVEPSAPFSDRLVGIYARLVALMCAAPDLTRIYMADAGAGEGRDRAVDAMDNLLGRTTALLDRAKERGELRPEVDGRSLAYNLWALYFVEQHRWLLDHPNAPDADPTPEIRRRLERPFVVQLAGYQLAPVS